MDALNRVTREDAVRDQGKDTGGAGFLEKLGGTSDGVGGVGEIVDEDGGAIGD